MGSKPFQEGYQLGIIDDGGRRASCDVGGRGDSSRQCAKEKGSFEAALIICGRGGKYEMSNEVKEMVLGLDCAPVSKCFFFRLPYFFRIICM